MDKSDFYTALFLLVLYPIAVAGWFVLLNWIFSLGA